MFTVKITDELGFIYGYEVHASEVASVVSEWVLTNDETPITLIEIEPII